MRRDALLALAIAAVVVATVGVVSWSGEGSERAPVASLPDLATMRCPDAALPAGTSTTTSTSVTTGTTAFANADALAALATSEGGPLPPVVPHGGHGTGRAQPPLRLTNDQRVALAAQLRIAIAAACALQTPADAQRAGYSMSSLYTQGVGTHWINWTLVGKPFDPARPSMLLYAPRLGVNRLVGFSFWSRAATEPAAFAGDNDTWHRHYGLCFDERGMLTREQVADAAQCDGTWLNGSDLWMLHAWVVPGQPNVWGMFAPQNPVLCDRNVPDILRCPGLG